MRMFFLVSNLAFDVDQKRRINVWIKHGAMRPFRVTCWQLANVNFHHSPLYLNFRNDANIPNRYASTRLPSFNRIVESSGNSG